MKVHVEHEVIGGETVLEEFKQVSGYDDPPMMPTIRLKFKDERDDKKLECGHVVKAEIEDNNE